jgi:hypothetical protein
MLQPPPPGPPAFTVGLATLSLIKKKKKNFLIYKEIQNGSGAKSYMRKGFLIYIRKCAKIIIYEEAVSHI